MDSSAALPIPTATSQCLTPPLPLFLQGKTHPMALTLRDHGSREYLYVPGIAAAEHNLPHGPHHEDIAEVFILDVTTDCHKPPKGL